MCCLIFETESIILILLMKVQLKEIKTKTLKNEENKAELGCGLQFAFLYPYL